MSEQRPDDKATSTCRLDEEPLRPQYRAIDTGAVEADHAHFALLYETHDELFAGALPFIREGLERGEHCLYVVDDTSKEAVMAAMRAQGIDVDAAREAGDLSLQTWEAYVKDGAFDPDAMIEFLEQRAHEVTTEEGYEGFRIAREMTWALSDDHSSDDLLDYEDRLNDFFATHECLGMCLYNHERFPSAILEGVIRRHPQVVYDGAVAQNCYYVPPDEGEHSRQTVERQLQTLADRPHATTTLDNHHSQNDDAEDSPQSAASQSPLDGPVTGVLSNGETGPRDSETEWSTGALHEGKRSFQEMIDALPEAIYTTDADGRLTYFNSAAVEFSGRTPELGTDQWCVTWQLHWPDGTPMPHDECPMAVAMKEERSLRGAEAIAERPDGTRKWFEAYPSPLRDEDGEIVGGINMLVDITEQKRSERIRREQTELLERIATGAPLEECLSALCDAVSRLNPGVRASILLADEEREAFQRPIAPDLSPSWGDGLEDTPINDLMIGTCGEAVFQGEPVTCEDVATDDRWSQDWRDLCVANGVEAGHSEPIRDADGDPAGSFMLCFDEPRAPNKWEQRLADFGTHIASIALERDRSQRALQESEERLRLATEAGEMGVWELDLQTNNSLSCSPRHDAIFGYEEPRDDWSVEIFLEHVHSADRERVEQQFADAFETGDLTFECRIIRADDEQRWITVQGEFYDDDAGEPVRAVGIVQDITEREKAEKTQRRLAAIVESSDDAIISKDLNGVIQTWNCAAEQLFGYTAQEAVGQPITMLFPPERVEEEDEILRRIRQGEQIDHYETVRRRKDGELLDISLTISPIKDAQGRITGASKIARDITERKEREQRLERQREQIKQLKDRLLETSPTGILVVDSAGDITLANERAAAILGRPREDLTDPNCDISQFEFVAPAGEPLADVDEPFEEVRTTGDPLFSREVGITRPDGQRVWLSVNAAPLYDDQADEMTETVVALEDITDHKQLNAALEQLNDASRELMAADVQDITDQAASIAQDVLDVEYTSLWHYDPGTGDLQLQTASTATGTAPDDIRYPDGFDECAWQVFISNDSEVSNELPPADGIDSSEEPIRSEVIVPLGRHGIICAGATQPNMFDATTVDLAQTVAANIEAALDRADSEQQLEAQNDELTQLDRINSIIREIDQGLVQAKTREDIDRLVCECFADSERYEFAWIGATEPGTDTVTPREWAGVDPGYLEELRITTDESQTGQGPVGTALRTRDPQVVEDIVTDARFAPWREQTLERDVRSCISIPLCYDDSLYGVLTVYTERVQSADRENEVLAELGETIGHAINAIETKRTLQTDSVVELSLDLRKPDTVLASLAQQAACTIEFKGLVPHADDAPTVFFTVHGASAGEIHRRSTDAIEIASVTCLRERENECLFKARIGGASLAAAFIAEDAVIQSLTIEETTVSAVVTLAQAGDVRPFVESIQSQFPSTDLVARRARERSRASEQDPQPAFEEHLTDRQQEVLHTAYLSGFFKTPRESTGQEIASLLDVSQPTFTQHLRRGQQSLFELLFDDG